MTLDEQRAYLESNLFAFARAVLGLTRLTDSVHQPLCSWLSTVPIGQRRKLLLLPRDHLKTSMVRALCAHMLIQKADTNIYFPGRCGSNTRILYASETIDLAEKQVQWLETQFDQNPRLRKLWPDRVWSSSAERKRKQSPWNQQEMQIPRKGIWPEPSVQAIGVGGAVAGRHYDVKIEDDLISLNAANSEAEMFNAIEWHKASFALMDSLTESYELTIGTRWAVYDLYSDMIENDPGLEYIVRAAIEEGKPLVEFWGDGKSAFSLAGLSDLRKRLGPLFFLLYMNSEADASLTDFDINEIRRFELHQDTICFDLDDRDLSLSRMLAPPGDILPSQKTRGKPLSQVIGSREYGPYELRARTASGTEY